MVTQFRLGAVLAAAIALSAPTLSGCGGEEQDDGAGATQDPTPTEVTAEARLAAVGEGLQPVQRASDLTAPGRSAHKPSLGEPVDPTRCSATGKPATPVPTASPLTPSARPRVSPPGCPEPSIAADATIAGR
jgi:hypothetical protein